MELNRAFPERAQMAGDDAITGVASTIGNVDRARRCFLPGAFGDKAFQVPLLAFHDDTQPIGTAKLSPNGKQLTHSSKLANLPRAPEFAEMILSGAIPATSIGWVSQEDYWGWSDLEAANPSLAKKAKSLGIPQREDVHYFALAEVVELSLVPVPANPLALIGVASLLHGGTQERAVLEHMIEMATGRNTAAGSRHSQTDQAAIQSAHDSLVTAGAACPTGAEDDGDPDADDMPGMGAPTPSDGITGNWRKFMRTPAAVDEDGIETWIPAPPPAETWAEIGALLAVAGLPQELANDIVGYLADVWTTQYVNDLPDSAFAYIEAGLKDKTGKTIPRSKRHFPHHDKGGSPDAPHVRNALARIPQSKVPDAAKSKALAHVQAHAKALGIGDDSGAGDPPPMPVEEVQESEPLDEAALADLDRQVAALLLG
jgi:hypothetical protein